MRAASASGFMSLHNFVTLFRKNKKSKITCKGEYFLIAKGNHNKLQMLKADKYQNITKLAAYFIIG